MVRSAATVAAVSDQPPVKLVVTTWQLVIAIAACAVLFVAGFLVGRVTGDRVDTDLVTGGLSGPTVTSRGLEGEAAGVDPDATEGATGGAGVAGPEAGSAANVTVEGLEVALVEVDIERVSFETGTPALTVGGRAAVEELAAILVANPFIPVEVEVRTFTEATPGENHGLSVGQAEAVVDALVDAGVDPARLVAVGLGGSLERPAGRTDVVRVAADDPDLDRALDALPLDDVSLDDDGSLGEGGVDVLAAAVELIAAEPSTPVVVVGYAYLDDPDASHDRSHALVDQVADYFVAAGVDSGRIDVVGLGDTPIAVDGVETEVELEVGSPAALALALREIDEERIQFEPGTATLTPGGRATLAEVATVLALDDTQRVEISAHTYTEGASEANHDLSHLQGEAVIAELVAAGIDPERLVLVAHGDPDGFRVEGRGSYVSFYELD